MHMRFTRNNDIKHTLTHVDTNSFRNFPFAEQSGVFGVFRLQVRERAHHTPFGPFHSFAGFEQDFKSFFAQTIFIHTYKQSDSFRNTTDKTFPRKCWCPYKSIVTWLYAFALCFQCIYVGRLLHFIHFAIKLFILSLACLRHSHTCKKLPFQCILHFIEKCEKREIIFDLDFGAPAA